MKTLIFIDWISPPDHENFNRAFFNAINVTNGKCFVFCKQLLNSKIPCELAGEKKNRIKGALSVLKLAIRYRRDELFFLTYDPLFFPLILLIKKNVVVYEHNTTPEKAELSRKVLWQKLFFKKITRLAQYPGQQKVLKEMGMNSVYIGSPLSFDRKAESRSQTKKDLYIAPSYRATLDQLEKVIPFIPNSQIIIKSLGYKQVEIKEKYNVTILPQERILMENNIDNIRAIIITVDSDVRGTGWFNDAIMFGIPLVITNEKAIKLISEVFPGYPFVDISKISSKQHFEECLTAASTFQTSDYVRMNNERFKNRFEFLHSVKKVSG